MDNIDNVIEETWETEDSKITDTEIANEEDPSAQTSAEESFTLKYLGEEKTVSKDQMVVLAQKGMDYDRIRGRLEELRTAIINGSDPRRKTNVEVFMEDYPGIDLDTIPDAVWNEVKAGKGLSAAYTRWENAVMREFIEASLKNQSARDTTTGSRSSSGKTSDQDEFLRFLMAE